MKRTSIRQTVALGLATMCMVAGASALTINDSYTVGTITPGIPADSSNIQTLLNDLLGLSLGGSSSVTINPGHHVNDLSRTSNTFSPMGSASFISGQSTSNGSSITIPTGGAEYLTAKYAGAGNSGGFTEVWYVGSFSGSISIPNNAGDGGSLGLSGYDFFTPLTKQVPDGGTTVLLLGAALSGLGLIRRKLA